MKIMLMPDTVKRVFKIGLKSTAKLHSLSKRKFNAVDKESTDCKRNSLQFHLFNERMDADVHNGRC